MSNSKKSKQSFDDCSSVAENCSRITCDIPMNDHDHNSSEKSVVALDGIASPMFAINTCGVVTAWNRKMQRVSGLPEVEVYRHNFAEFLIDKTSWNSALHGVIQSGMEGRDDDGYCTVVLRDHIRTGGTSATFRLRIVANRSLPGNQVVGAICFVELRNDMSEEGMDSSLAATVTRNTSEIGKTIAAIGLTKPTISMAEKTRQVIDLACFPIFGIDKNGCINEWNSKMVEITGIEQNEVMSKSVVEDFFALPFRGTIQDLLTSSNAGICQGKQYFELELRSAAGEMRRLLFTFANRSGCCSNENDILFIAYDIPLSGAQHQSTAPTVAIELGQLIDKADLSIFALDGKGYGIDEVLR
jgi:PAS domain-containing protein